MSIGNFTISRAYVSQVGFVQQILNFFITVRFQGTFFKLRLQD
jgi:hypothetical protein